MRSNEFVECLGLSVDFIAGQQQQIISNEYVQLDAWRVKFFMLTIPVSRKLIVSFDDDDDGDNDSSDDLLFRLLHQYDMLFLSIEHFICR